MTPRKSAFLFLLLSLIILPVVLVAAQTIRIKSLSHRMDYVSHPFERKIEGAPMNVLFLGDSTAVGTGSRSAEQSTAGWLAHEFPQASVENISQNGLRLAGLKEKLPHVQKDHYDLIIVQIGANDVIRLTPFSRIEKDFRFIMENLCRHSERIVVLHSGNIGAAPIFIWPFNTILSNRSYRLRQLYKDLSQTYHFRYVDLIAANLDHAFSDDINKYYAPDRLHLTGEGYHLWYKAIRAEMTHLGFN